MRPVFVRAGVLIVCLVLLALLIVSCASDEPAATVSTAGSPTSTTTSVTGGSTTTSAPVSGDNSEEKVFTPAEPAQFDGREGRHTTCFLDSKAGNDLAGELKQAPSNMRALVEQLPVVGRLEQ